MVDRKFIDNPILCRGIHLYSHKVPHRGKRRFPSDWNFQRCLEFASAALEILVQKTGARGGLPSLLKAQNYMKTNQQKEMYIQ